MRAAESLELRIDSRGGAGARLRGLVARVTAAARSEGAAAPEPLDEALVVRRSSGHPVLRGPVAPGLRRFLRKAVESDLAAMTEADFLRAWGPPGGWQQRYERWQERGWVPPVR